MSLSVTDVVNVSVNLSPQAAQTENFGALLALGSSDVIDTKERIRKYTSLTGVATDFSTTSPEYACAALFFGQSPSPAVMYAGRYAKTATSGRMYGGSLSTAQQALSNFTTISDGSMHVTVDGTVKTLASIDLTGATNLNSVASDLTTALAGAVVTYDAVNHRFQFVSPTSGTSSKISFGSSTGSGTDLSTLLNLTAATGASTVDGIAAESLLDAVTILAGKSNDWYGLHIADASPATADVLAVAGFIEAASPARLFAVTTQDANTLDSTSTTDLAYQLSQLQYNKTATQYSSSSPYAACSLFARQASVDFTAQNSTITLMFKQEPGVSAEDLIETQYQTLLNKHTNVFAKFSNSTALITPGQVSSGSWIDTTVGLDWFRNQIQTDVFNGFYQSASKFPQTDAGVHQIVAIVSRSCDQAANNGLLAPGIWTGSAIGPLQNGGALNNGYFVYAPPVSSQSSADRSARKSPTIQVAAKLGGAIHSADVVVTAVQ